MNSRRSLNEDRLSTFGQRLQSLSDTFYSTILEEPKEKKIQIKNAQQLEDFQSNDFTFDECSSTQITSNDNFSFTFHSLDQPKKQTIKRINNHSSTPYSIHQENCTKKSEDETIVVEETRSPRQPVIIGYYPVISYQPVCLPPPTIYLSKEQIQSQIINDYSTLTKITPIKSKK